MYSGGEAFRVNFAIRLALSEILAQRSELEPVLTASIRRLVEERLEKLHLEAVRTATGLLESEEPAALPLDASRRWTLAQILGEENDPIG